jgi:hypothetical protein
MNLRAKRRSVPPRPVVYRWDLDKTYLKSEFDSLREMMRIPFEKPEDKRVVPGVVPLIRNLRRVAEEQGREVRIYFISASPPQISKAIKDRLALDGVEYDGIVFKNQLQYLVRGKFRVLREQVGFKLTELLKNRRDVPSTAREVLFGDDWESDPLIYSLYADVLAGRIAPTELADILKTIGVDPPLIAEARELATAAPRGDVVEKIYINLERRTPPTNFRSFGTRLVPTFNYFQSAACLFDTRHLTLPAVAEVAGNLVSSSAYTPQRLANSLADVLRRGHLRQSSAAAIRDHLRPLGLLPQRERAAARPSVWRRLVNWFAAAPQPAATPPHAINYHTLVTEWRTTR